MATDPLHAGLESADAAGGGDRPPQAAAIPPQEFADLAAAIERVEALIAAATAAEPDQSGAVERIADIAFVLHERNVEASLCDALDAAVREISDAGAIKQASAQRAQQAAELLRELSRRINDMMAMAAAPRSEPLTAAQSATAPEAAEAAIRNHDECEDTEEYEDTIGDDMPSADGLLEADLKADDDFAQAVAALAASLPALAELDEPELSAEREAAVGPHVPPVDAQASAPAEQPLEASSAAADEADFSGSASSAEVVLLVESTSAVFAVEQALLEASAREASPGPQSAESAAPLAEMPSGQTPSEPAPIDAIASEAVTSEDSPGRPAPPGEAPSEAALPKQPPGESASNADSTGDVSAGAELPIAAMTAQPFSPADLTGKDAADAAGLAAPEAVLVGLDLPLPGESAPSADKVPSESAADVRQTEAAGELEPRGGADPILGVADNENSLVREMEASPAPSPEAQPSLGPQDDPGDLFETEPDSPVTARSEPLVPTAAAPAPSSAIESNGTDGGGPAGASEAQSLWDMQAPVAIRETQKLAEIAAPDDEAAAITPSAEPQGKPAISLPPRPAVAPPQATARTLPNDPLAPVHGLSEEELIALFS